MVVAVAGVVVVVSGGGGAAGGGGGIDAGAAILYIYIYIVPATRTANCSPRIAAVGYGPLPSCLAYRYC